MLVLIYSFGLTFQTNPEPKMKLIINDAQIYSSLIVYKFTFK